jgi:hypothetical protein
VRALERPYARSGEGAPLILSRELALFGADAFLWALRGQWRRLRRMLAAAVEAVLSLS